MERVEEDDGRRTTGDDIPIASVESSSASDVHRATRFAVIAKLRSCAECINRFVKIAALADALAVHPANPSAHLLARHMSPPDMAKSKRSLLLKRSDH